MTLSQNSLGRTGLSVTTLGYGAMEVRGPRIWGGRPIEDADAEQILNAVVDNGITFIDTANDYGRSEEYIGRFLSHRRNEFVLATKCGCTVCARREHRRDSPCVDQGELVPRLGREPGADATRLRRCDAAAQTQRRALPPPVLDNPVTTVLNGTGSRQRLGC